jgi:Cys-tRNA(Pro)/Cys-tRNA(Cys) deacylase
MTPAIKRLQQVGVAHGVLRYDPREVADLGYSQQVAAALEVPPDHVFKTLICEIETGELVVAVLPGPNTLDLRKLARSAGVKKATMADAVRAQRATGYVTGGISPFGQRQQLDTYLDASALDCQAVYVSGGRRGLELQISPRDLVAQTAARVVDIVRA